MSSNVTDTDRMQIERLIDAEKMLIDREKMLVLPFRKSLLPRGFYLRLFEERMQSLEL